jgi:hypothetical protein
MPYSKACFDAQPTEVVMVGMVMRRAKLAEVGVIGVHTVPKPRKQRCQLTNVTLSDLSWAVQA